jgi:hypothetical protein
MSKLRYLLIAVPLAGAAWLWLGHQTPAVHAEPAVTRPSVLVAPGRVEPVHDAVKLAFEAQGRIAEILVDEGDAVHAGQALARLDDRLAKARVAAALAGLSQAKARYLLAREVFLQSGHLNTSAPGLVGSQRTQAKNRLLQTYAGVKVIEWTDEGGIDSRKSCRLKTKRRYIQREVCLVSSSGDIWEQSGKRFLLKPARFVCSLPSKQRCQVVLHRQIDCICQAQSSRPRASLRRSRN